MTEAAKAASATRSKAYKLRAEDPTFADEWETAREESADLLEQEARRRATEGVDEPVFYLGQPCGTIRRYSDTLLIFLLKGARPEKFRERSDIRHSGSLAVEDAVVAAADLARRRREETRLADAAEEAAAGDAGAGAGAVSEQGAV